MMPNDISSVSPDGDTEPLVEVQVVEVVAAASTTKAALKPKKATAPPKIHPPAMLKGYSLAQLLEWYEAELCAKKQIDPRGHEVVFDVSRFMYLIKLVDLNGDKVKKPLWHAEELKAGRLTEHDFGSFHPHRAETLSWLPWLISAPLRIRKNTCLHVPGEEVYIREVNPKHRERFKLLYCDRLGPELLVPVTSFRQNKEPKGEILWP